MTAPDTNVELLESLLDAEREALLSGDLETIGEMLTEKEALIARVIDDRPGPDHPVSALKEKMQRNQLLLDGAMDGIRSVAARLAALRQVRDALDTYDAQGRKQTVKQREGGKIERRA